MSDLLRYFFHLQISGFPVKQELSKNEKEILILVLTRLEVELDLDK